MHRCAPLMTNLLRYVAVAALGSAVGSVIGVAAYYKAVNEGQAGELTLAGLLVLGSSFGGVTGLAIYRLRAWRSRGRLWRLLAWGTAGAAGMLLPGLLGYLYFGDLSLLLFGPLVGIGFGLPLGVLDGYISS